MSIPMSRWRLALRPSVSCLLLGTTVALLGACSPDSDWQPAPPSISRERASRERSERTPTTVDTGLPQIGDHPGTLPLPPGLQNAFRDARRADRGRAYRFAAATAGTVLARNAVQHVDVALAKGELGVSAADGAGWHLGLRWTGIGRGRAMAAVDAPIGGARVAGTRGSYVRPDGSEEWYENGPRGVEQGFDLTARPAGDPGEAVAIEVSATGDLTPALDADGVSLRDARGVTQARYTDLTAFDARGAALKAWIEVDGAIVRLRIDDAGARYPLHVDPLVWTQQTVLTADDGALGDELGLRVALDGNTALLSALGKNQTTGAVYVFTKSGGVWTQSAELTASDGMIGDGFGYAIALEGHTALVGAPIASPNGVYKTGAAYVFTESNGVWTQSAELTGSNPSTVDGFGAAVALSGNTAVVGANSHTVGSDFAAGAAYVFSGSSGTWTQQAELTAPDWVSFDQLGSAVAIAGTTVAVSSPRHTVDGVPEAGTIYMFDGSSGTYTLTAQVAAQSPGASDNMGFELALSGNLLVAGAPLRVVNGLMGGAALVFSQSGGVWAQEAELSASDAATTDFFGYDVAVQGNTVLVGAPLHQTGANPVQGAVYAFTRSGSVWSADTQILAADGETNDYFGYSVAIQGGDVLIGAPGRTIDGAFATGAAYLFAAGSSGCTIGSSSFAAGAVNPANPCQVCDPSQSAVAWSNATDGASCDDGHACTTGDACQAGACTGTLVTTGACAPITVTIRRSGASGSVADALIGPVVTKNSGASASLAVGRVSGNDRAALVRFDLSAIPAGAHIVSATATLYAYQSSGSQQTRAHVVTAPWSESTVTWASFPSNGYQAAAAAIFPGVADVLASSNQLLATQADLTATVAAWYSGAVPNDGIFLEQNLAAGTQGSSGTTSFSSSEWTGLNTSANGPTQRPALTVTYIPNY